MANATGGYRSRSGISEMHRRLPLPNRLPRAPRSPAAREIHRTALPHSYCCAGDASARHRRSHRGIAKRAGDRLLQHHQVLHESLPRKHSDHRQWDHSAKRARRGRVLRSVWMGLEETQENVKSLKKVRTFQAEMLADVPVLTM